MRMGCMEMAFADCGSVCTMTPHRVATFEAVSSLGFGMMALCLCMEMEGSNPMTEW